MSLLPLTLSLAASLAVDARPPNEEARQKAARVRASLLTGDWDWYLRLSEEEAEGIRSGMISWIDHSPTFSVAATRIEQIKRAMLTTTPRKLRCPELTNQAIDTMLQAPTFDEVFPTWEFLWKLNDLDLCELGGRDFEEELIARPWRGTMYGIPHLYLRDVWPRPLGWDDPTHQVLLSSRSPIESYATWSVQALKDWIKETNNRRWEDRWPNELREILGSNLKNLKSKRTRFLPAVQRLRGELDDFSMRGAWPVIPHSYADNDTYAHPGGAEPPLLTALLKMCLAELT